MYTYNINIFITCICICVFVKHKHTELYFTLYLPGLGGGPRGLPPGPDLGGGERGGGPRGVDIVFYFILVYNLTYMKIWICVCLCKIEGYV